MTLIHLNPLGLNVIILTPMINFRIAQTVVNIVTADSIGRR